MVIREIRTVKVPVRDHRNSPDSTIHQDEVKIGGPGLEFHPEQSLRPARGYREVAPFDSGNTPPPPGDAGYRRKHDHTCLLSIFAPRSLPFDPPRAFFWRNAPVFIRYTHNGLIKSMHEQVVAVANK